MNNSILSLYEKSESEEADESPFALLPKRAQCVETLVTNPNFDLLILGGGLTGALVAHQAALQGIRVLLLESKYCGSHALSWDHRISHLLRVAPRQVLTGRKPLRELAKTFAPHITGPFPRDSHAHEGQIAALAQRFTPLCNLDERLLIRECILAARQEGAIVLASTDPQYVEVESLSGCYMVGFKDALSNTVHEVRVGGILVDPASGHLPPSRLGTPLLRLPDVAVAGCQRIYQAVPRIAKSGVRFASFELSNGSFVSVSRIADQMIEITVLYGVTPLTADVVTAIAEQAASETGWTLQLEISSRDVDSRWSNKWDVKEQRGIFSCSHRAPWDAFKSATTIVRRLVGLQKEPKQFKKLTPRLLPGVEQACELEAFRAMARAQGIRERLIELCIARWRGRVRYIAQFPNGLYELCPNVLRGEIDLAYLSDQPTTIEDVMFGSLSLHQLPGWRELVKPVSDRFALLTDSR